MSTSNEVATRHANEPSLKELNELLLRVSEFKSPEYDEKKTKAIMMQIGRCIARGEKV